MRDRLVEQLKSIDPVELISGTLPAVSGILAFTGWSSVLVRKIRGEDVASREEWGLGLISALFVFIRSVVSREYARGAIDLRRTVVEMHAVAREAAEDAEQRDQRAARQQDRLSRLTERLVLLAGLTLAAAIVALVVTLVNVI
jgi:hypothetical protein